MPASLDRLFVALPRVRDLDLDLDLDRDVEREDVVVRVVGAGVRVLGAGVRVVGVRVLGADFLRVEDRDRDRDREDRERCVFVRLPLMGGTTDFVEMEIAFYSVATRQWGTHVVQEDR